jgi:hypothetical protein
VHGSTIAAGGVGVFAETPQEAPPRRSPAWPDSAEVGPYHPRRTGQGTRTGAALTAASLVLTIVQQHRDGVHVQTAVPDIAASSFTVFLSKAVPASTKVAWFIVN